MGLIHIGFKHLALISYLWFGSFKNFWVHFLLHVVEWRGHLYKWNKELYVTSSSYSSQLIILEVIVFSANTSLFSSSYEVLSIVSNCSSLKVVFLTHYRKHHVRCFPSYLHMLGMLFASIQPKDTITCLHRPLGGTHAIPWLALMAMKACNGILDLHQHPIDTIYSGLFLGARLESKLF